MTSFWTLSTNELAKGDAESSHVKPMGSIPDGTQAPAVIKQFIRAQPTDSYPHECYEIHCKLASGEFKGREVRLKIKCFDAKPSISDRGINMLKRIYDLCDHKPTHSEAPTEKDLLPMVGKIIGVKISEYVFEKNDGSTATGNYVSEVHKADKDFETVTGAKIEVSIPPRVETAFSRNAQNGLPLDDSGIPF